MMKDLANVVKLMMIEKKDVLLSILFGFIAGITGVGLFSASGYLISKAALLPPLHALIILTSTVKLLGFIRAISRYAERLFSHRATFTILSHLRVSFYEKLVPLAPGIFHKFRSGDLLARIVGDVESLQNFFLRVFYPPMVLVMVFLSTMLFTTFFSIYIALLLLVGLLFTVLIVPAWFARRQMNIDHHVRENRGALSTEVAQLLHGFRDLKIYQQLEKKEEQVLAASDRYIEEQKNENINVLYSESANSFVALFMTWLVLGVGAYLVVNDQLAGIFLAMLVMTSMTVFEDVGPMAAFPNHLQDNSYAATRLFSVVRAESDDKVEQEQEQGQAQDQAQDQADVVKRLQLPDGQPPDIRMDHVTFTFPNEWRKTLDDVSLSIPAGSKTAIVGPSGSGKSTLLQLLLKIVPTQQGSVMINDLPIEQVEQESIWKAANVVLQSNHFFYGTIRDNLLIDDHDISDEQMLSVLAKVKLEHLSLIDAVLERGENLSGGEKQRLAMARAMLKGGRFWILDEPTSSVDALTERAIYEQLFAHANDDTVIVVSHRLTGLEQMDQIIVMEHGKVIEAGAFDELIAQEGYFYKLKQLERNLI